jgi:hypothetical protein
MFDPVVEEQPVDVEVNLNLAAPWRKPVTTPALLTDATAPDKLTQFPPDEGSKLVVLPSQIEGLPAILTTGFGFTVILIVSKEGQELEDCT